MNSTSNTTDFSESPSNMSCVHTSAFTLTFGGIIVFDITAGFASNMAVLYVMVRDRGGHISSDIFGFILACTELVVCPSLLMSYLQNVSYKFLSIQPFLDVTSGFVFAGRPLLQCCICVERYVAVVHPIIFLKYKALRYKLPLLACICLTITIMAAYNYYIKDNFMMSVVIPVLAVESYCGFSILRTLKKPRPGDGEREEMNHIKRRAFRIIQIIQVKTMVNYIPITTAKVMSSLFPYMNIANNCIITKACFTLLVLGSSVHPFLYLSKEGKLPCVNRTSHRNS